MVSVLQEEDTAAFPDVLITTVASLNLLDGQATYLPLSA